MSPRSNHRPSRARSCTLTALGDAKLRRQGSEINSGPGGAARAWVRAGTASWGSPERYRDQAHVDEALWLHAAVLTHLNGVRFAETVSNLSAGRERRGCCQVKGDAASTESKIK